jgi:hypothetical protein
MQGYSPPKSKDELENAKKCTFIFNYCFQEGDSAKPIQSKLKGTLKSNENYLKLVP